MKATKVFFLIISVILTGCSSMYIPSSKNVPLFEKKNEVQVEVGASPNSVYMTGGYAFTNKYAFIVNGSMSFLNFSKWYDIWWSSEEERPSGFLNGPSDHSSFAHRYIEAGFGRYNLLSSPRRFLRIDKFEVFGGGGYGYALQSPKVAILENNFYENKYWLGFVQANAGRRSKFYEFGFSLRLAFSRFNFTYIPEEPWKGDPILKLNFNNFHIEPLAVFRLGKGSIHGFVRGGFNITCTLTSFPGIELEHGINGDSNSQNADLYDIIGITKLDYTVLHLSVGISYRIK